MTGIVVAFYANLQPFREDGLVRVVQTIAPLAAASEVLSLSAAQPQLLEPEGHHHHVDYQSEGDQVLCSMTRQGPKMSSSKCWGHTLTRHQSLTCLQSWQCKTACMPVLGA